MIRTQTGIERPVVAISSCLLGEKVRYDGQHKKEAGLVQYFAGRVDWKPVCPEVGAGLGVPRPPVRLTGDASAPSALGVENPGLDVTDTLAGYARAMIQELRGVSGYIFKSRSPSCGLTDAPLFDADGRQKGFTSGIYVRVITAALPDLPTIDEQRLGDEHSREQFLQQVLACWRWQKAGTP